MKAWTNAICLTWTSRPCHSTSPETQLEPLPLWNLTTLNPAKVSENWTIASTFPKTSDIHALKMSEPSCKSSFLGKTQTKINISDLARILNNSHPKTNSGSQPRPSSKMLTKCLLSALAPIARLSH